MTHLIKNHVSKSILILLMFALFSNSNMFAQEIEKYDFAEVTIKIKGNTGKFFNISLISISDSDVKEKMTSETEKLTTTSALLRYMNINNWEYVDRASDLWGSVIWLNYIFKKRIE